MAITPKFTPAQVRKQLEKRVGNIEKAIVNRLQFVGEKFITNARNNHTYTDQTGNLTASIGYVILKNGEQIINAFPGDKPQGQAAAKAIAEEVSVQHNKGFVLIVVAGMSYAAAVESKNLDVLTASSFEAEKDLRKSIAELSSKISRMQ